MADRMGVGQPQPHPHSSSSGAPLQPTFYGYVNTTMDALVLFEACLTGRLHHVPRRPHDRERAQLIVSGNIFIYEEHSSGIKRWTDGIPWSPSRILGNFLLYRELDKPFQPGEKKRAMKKTKESNGVTKPSTAPRSNSVGYAGMAANAGYSAAAPSTLDPSITNRETERALVGSLVDSYQFKSDGLIKKTISVQYKGMHHHMVSYYNIGDVVNNRLRSPQDELRDVSPRSALISAGNFRAPVDDVEMGIDEHRKAGMLNFYYDINMNRSMSVPSLHQYPNSVWPGGHYAANANYGALPHAMPAPSYASQPSAYSGSYDPTGARQAMAAQGYQHASMTTPRRPSLYVANGSNHYMDHTNLGTPGTGGRTMSGGSLMSNGHVGTNGITHAAFNGSSMFESPAPAATSSQHGAIYSDSARAHATYDSGTNSQHTSSFSSQMPSAYESTVAGGSGSEFNPALPSHTAATSFESSGDDTPNGGMSISDVDHGVMSPMDEPADIPEFKPNLTNLDYMSHMNGSNQYTTGQPSQSVGLGSY